jgi:putative NADPH-quinone reductase
MKVLVILAHPQEGSFNHAIAQAAIERIADNGHTVFFHDLYKEGFDPLLKSEEIPKDNPLPATISQHCEEIAEADGIVVVHPNWWGQPPAILKGWVDRVIRPGIAYEFVEGDTGEGVPRGLLKAKVALVYNTSNTEALREKTVFGDPLEAIWNHCIFGLCGVATFHRRMFSVVVTSSEGLRNQWLDQTRKDIDVFFAKKSASAC